MNISDRVSRHKNSTKTLNIIKILYMYYLYKNRKEKIIFEPLGRLLSALGPHVKIQNKYLVEKFSHNIIIFCIE